MGRKKPGLEAKLPSARIGAADIIISSSVSSMLTGKKFGRVYTDKDKATRFAERQRRSPVVKSARITQVS